MCPSEYIYKNVISSTLKLSPHLYSSVSCEAAVYPKRPVYVIHRVSVISSRNYSCTY